MNKSTFITTAAKKAGLTQKDMAAALAVTLEAITESLANKEDIQLIGFGTFSTAERAARDGINPSTGEKIKIAATTVAKFKVGASLKEAVKAQ